MRHFAVDPANPFSTKAMVQAVRDGERLVIFPEGRITKTGALMKVYEGAGMVADKADALIVPMRIDGLQFTRVSRMAGRVPRSWFPRLSLTVLPPVRLERGRGAARPPAAPRRWALLLQRIMEESSLRHRQHDRSLFRALLDAKARFGAMPVIEDIERKPLGYRRIVLGAAVLGRRLAEWRRRAAMSA